MTTLNRALGGLLLSLMTLPGVLTVSGCSLWRQRPPVTVTEVKSQAVPSLEATAAGKPAAAMETPAIRETVIPRAPIAAAPTATPRLRTWERSEAAADYRIGDDDELAISVYGDTDLSKTQLVRPGGKIAFPLVGEIMASGRTPEELSREIAQRLTPYVKNPRVTVIISKFNSRRLSVLGEVKTPGIVGYSSDITLLEAVSRGGGLTEDADLLGALLVRGGEIEPVDFYALFKRGDMSQNAVMKAGDAVLIPSVKDKKVLVLGQVTKPLVVALTPALTLVEAIARAGGLTDSADLAGALLVREGRAEPVDFDRLFRKGDLSQNALLKANDVVMIPNIADKKVFVLGEVAKAQVLSLRAGTTLVEAISTAGGFTINAKRSNVLIVRGGLGDPKIITVDVDAVTKEGQVAANVRLEPGDIVYAPRSVVADVVKFFQDLNTILTPFVVAMSGIVLGPTVQAVLTGQGIAQGTTVVVPAGR